MAWLFRNRSRWRRVAREKTADVPRRKARGLKETLELAARLVLAVAVVAVCTYMVMKGPPPPRFELNRQSRETVVARSNFRVVNWPVTQALRGQARNNVRSYYIRDASVDNLKSVQMALDAIFDEKSLDELKKHFEGFPIHSQEAWTAISDEARRGYGIKTNIFFLVRRVSGIISDEDMRREQSQPRTGRIEIGLHKDDATAPRILDVGTEVSTPDGLKERIRTQLQSDLGKTAAEAIGYLTDKLSGAIKPDLAYKLDKTDQLRAEAEKKVEPQYDEYPEGKVIVPEGKTIDEQILDALLKNNALYQQSISLTQRVEKIIGGAVLIAVLIVLAGLHIRNEHPRVLHSIMRLFFLALLLVAMVALAKVFAYLIVHQGRPLPLLYWFPFSMAPILLAAAYDRRFALVFAGVQAVLVGMVFGEHLQITAILASGAFAAVHFTYDVRTRSRLAEAGLAAGITQFVLTWALAFWSETPGWLPTLTNSFYALANGVLCGLVMSGIMPFIERYFNVLTGIRLLEMADLNQPIFRKFALAAPGSYNHSMSVGSLAEHAAEAIGANGLLARVGGYYHDIGKINKPQYFIENLTGGASVHESLTSPMSSLVIRAHPKDGMDVAQQLKLPTGIRNIILEHHGTMLVEYFYRQARRLAGDSDDLPEEQSYRYPGPKPQSREAAIVMLSDASESASRSLAEPTPQHIENLVNDLAEKRLLSGQFDECGLTLKELAAIKQSLIKSLIAIYHSRIKY